MNLGFDLDGIFVDVPPLIPKSLIEKLYVSQGSKTLQYRIPGKIEQKIRQLSHVRFLRPLIAESLTVLKILEKDKSDNLFLITSRFGFLEKQTKNILYAYGLTRFFHHMYFNLQNEQPHLFKSRMIEKLGIDKFIDDDLSLLQFLAKKHNETQFFWLNKKIQRKISDNLFAITSMKDFLS